MFHGTKAFFQLGKRIHVYHILLHLIVTRSNIQHGLPESSKLHEEDHSLDNHHSDDRGDDGYNFCAGHRHQESFISPLWKAEGLVEPAQCCLNYPPAGTSIGSMTLARI